MPSAIQAILKFFVELFTGLAALGFILVLSALGLALYGNLPLANAMATFLFPGIFVVWLPTVLVGIRLSSGVRQKDFWKVTLSGCPPWMRSSLYVLIACGAALFVFNVVLLGNRKDLPMIYFGAGHMLIFYGVALHDALLRPALPVSALGKALPERPRSLALRQLLPGLRSKPGSPATHTLGG